MFSPSCGNQKKKKRYFEFLFQLLSLKFKNSTRSLLSTKNPWFIRQPIWEKMVLILGPEKYISSDLFRRGKSTAYCVHHSMRLIQMGEGTVWCTSRISTPHGKLFNDTHNEFAFPYHWALIQFYVLSWTCTYYFQAVERKGQEN